MKVVSCYRNNSELAYYNMVIELFRNKTRIVDLEMIFTTDSKRKRICDRNSDYARLIDDRKFTSCYIFILSDRLLYHL